MNEQQKTLHTRFLELFDYDDMPFPEHERMKFGAMRVHIYHGDEKNFTILYETMMFSGEDHQILKNHGFGNFFFIYKCKDGEFSRQGWWDEFPMSIACPDDHPHVSVIADSESDQFVEDTYQRQALNPDARTILVRDQSIDIPHDPHTYRKHNIETRTPIQLISVLRYLLSFKPDLVFSIEEDRALIVGSQKKILQLDDWNHLNLNEDYDEFYETESVQMLTKAALTGDASHYKPTQPSNTKWWQR